MRTQTLGVEGQNEWKDECQAHFQALSQKPAISGSPILGAPRGSGLSSQLCPAQYLELEAWGTSQHIHQTKSGWERSIKVHARDKSRNPLRIWE